MTVVVTQMPHMSSSVGAKPTGPILPDVLGSEWTKLRTVRSTYWTLLAAAVAMIGLSVIVCSVYVAQYASLSVKDKATFDPITSSLAGGFLAQLAIAVLGVLVITSEYGSGMIRATFAAVPQRLTVLAAKASVFAGVTFVVSTVACFVAFFAGQAILSSKGIGVGLGAPGALRIVVGSGLYLAVLGLLALGLGTIIRRTAGAIASVFGLIFVLPSLALLLPSSMDAIQKYLPSNAGQALIGGGSRGTNDLSPWVGFGVFCLYAVAALVIAGATLRRRDA
ncbi:MAG: type transport system permease protein [Acidimicrobiaceae bacterium]|nr:type transport system permease protein [Acidimicrobiaceae bacterium]MDQ1364989.1 type transport system permease protein [Acidimicrobiaceae bacterium]MDQ1369695.1 type transport system permease protein [Acidimicrobiaceae bacterium]MDQ1378489.1 type transport system permease protein [Acidimicrobiaceae bacterium]MDQ1399102.1 type transport system permease protein [Acidimicrobiaceae bacterium]